MKKTYSKIPLVAFFLGMVAVSSVWAADAFIGNISMVDGNVNITRKGKADVVAAKAGDALFAGDTVKTGDNSKVQIMLGDNSTIYVAPNSNMQLKDYLLSRNEEKRNITVKAFFGKIRFVVAKIYKVSASGSQRSWRDSSFSVETPTAVAGIKGTDFVITVSPTHTTFSVFEGLVGTRNVSSLIKGEVMLGANQASTVKKDAPPKPPIQIAPQQKQMLIMETTPPIVAKKEGGEAVVAAAKEGKDAQVAEIAKDVAAKVSVKDVIEKAIDKGMNVDEAAAAAMKAGVDTQAVVYAAITEGYSGKMVVEGAIEAGAKIEIVVKAAVAAGADTKEIAAGAKDAGVTAEVVASAISTATSSDAPVFGFTAPVADATPLVDAYIAPAIITVSGGGGATPSTKTATTSTP